MLTSLSGKKEGESPPLKGGKVGKSDKFIEKREV
jgi:hypothetical protein